MAKIGNKHADEKVAARTSITGLPGAPAPLLARRRHEGFGGQIFAPAGGREYSRRPLIGGTRA
jgi:hypothetical protein